MYAPHVAAPQEPRVLEPSYLALQCLNGRYFQENNATGALSCSGDPRTPELFRASIYGDELVTVPGIPLSAGDIIRSIVRGGGGGVMGGGVQRGRHPRGWQAGLRRAHSVPVPRPHPARTCARTQIFAFASENLLQSLVVPNVLSVMCLSLVFGLAVAHVTPHGGGHGSGGGRVLAEILTQLREAMVLIIERLIALAPYGLVFLMAGTVAAASE
jgi:hypothetical protein